MSRLQRTRATLLVAGLILPACAPPDPTGHYATDPVQHAREIADDVPEFVRKALGSPAEGSPGNGSTDTTVAMELDIDQDGTFTMTLRPPAEGLVRHGTWSQDGHTVILRADDEAVPESRALLQTDRLVLNSSPGGAAIILVRSTPR